MYRATLLACVRSGFRNSYKFAHGPTLPANPTSSMVSLLEREEALGKLNHWQPAGTLILVRLPRI